MRVAVSGSGVEEGLDGERAVQADRDEADLLAPPQQLVHDLGRRAGARPHEDDDPVGIRCAVIVHERVATTGALPELVEDLLHDRRHGVVESVGRLARLEEDIRVLRTAPQHRPLRREAVRPVVEHVLVADEGAQVVVVEQGDLVDLMGGAEAVEEVQERNARAQRRRVRDEREVVRLLHARRAQERPPGAARRHHVGVVAEDRQGVSGQCPRSHVDDRRGQLAGDLVHVRQHEEQALRCGERRAERALLERTVQGTRGAALGLHLHHLGHGAPQVRAAGRAPRIRELAHRRGGRDRVDGAHITEAVGHQGHRLVAVQTGPLHHCIPPPLGRPDTTGGICGQLGSFVPPRAAEGRDTSVTGAQALRFRRRG